MKRSWYEWDRENTTKDKGSQPEVARARDESLQVYVPPGYETMLAAVDPRLCEAPRRAVSPFTRAVGGRRCRRE